MKKMNSLFVILLSVGLTLAGCNGDNGEEDDVTTDEDVQDVTQEDRRVDDVPADRDVGPDDVPVEDMVEDDTIAEDVEEDGEIPPPPPCEAPPEPEIGMECESAADCDGYFPRCFEEGREEFNGEEYITWPGGTCALQGTGDLVCDIDDPVDTCPEGMRCVYFYAWGDTPVYGCLDACTSDVPDTDPPELYDFNCGCREGYECDKLNGTCSPGCSHDRGCCEVWRDDGDYVREEGEVEVLAGCTNRCDNDLMVDGGASYSCINEGTAGAEFSGACIHNSQCPADGRCLDPIWYTDDDGNPNFPGGYCLKDRCDAVGRGCSDGSGHCGNLGTDSDPFWTCMMACNLGDDPDGADFPCRKEPAEEKMTCMPIFSDTPFFDTTDYDGYCWYGNFTSVTDPNYDTDCTEPGECFSPLGLGNCYTLADVDVNFCSAICTEDLAVNHAVCGANAEGVCWAEMSGMCWPACDTPGGDLGANGCPVTTPPEWACYATADWSDDTFVAGGATMPAGLCFPACDSDEECSDMFDMAMTCNPTTGVCQ